MLKNKWLKKLLFILLGGIGGFAYYYFIGCNTNACPLTSNPYISTGYGMGVGLLLGWDSRPKSTEKVESN